MEKYSIVNEWLNSVNNIHTPLYKCSSCGESYYKMKVDFILIQSLSILKLKESKLEKYNKLSNELKRSWNVFNFNHIIFKDIPSSPVENELIFDSLKGSSKNRLGFSHF